MRREDDYKVCKTAKSRSLRAIGWKKGDRDNMSSMNMTRAEDKKKSVHGSRPATGQKHNLDNRRSPFDHTPTHQIRKPAAGIEVAKMATNRIISYVERRELSIQ